MIDSESMIRTSERHTAGMAEPKELTGEAHEIRLQFYVAGIRILINHLRSTSDIKKVFSIEADDPINARTGRYWPV